MKTKIFQDYLNDSLCRYKDYVAIECGSRSMNYAELENRTNHIANQILNKGIKKETLIGILIDDRMEFIYTMIGILKAGGVVVPLDSTLPTDRLKAMIHTTNTKFVIGDQTNLNQLISNNKNTNATTTINPSFEFIRVEDLFLNKKSSWLTNRPKILYTPEDKIYIYFTSGTSGIPRAILGKNKSLLHFIRWEIQTFGINETFRVSQLTSPGFDAFLRDIFVPLFSGGTVCCPDNKELLLESQELMNWIERSRIHLIHCVPSLFRLLNTNGLTNDQFKELKYILFSGERVKPADLVNWYNTFDERIQLVNLWGTSETTMAKTCYFIQKNDVNLERIPVGKPIKGAVVVVLDKYKKICNEQVKGELYIRTPFRTFGYLNNLELTHQRFIQNPFNDDPNDFLHVTGDYGQLLPGGNIDFLGRTDRQVKIRGIRIELEEIENELLKYPQVKEVVVIKMAISSTNEFLCAYVSTDLKVEPDANANDEVEANHQEVVFKSNVYRYLSSKLPDYMIPAYFVNIENIPRKPNGKIDYNHLPNPLEVEKKKYIPPKNDVEKKLVQLWSDILKIEKIGVNAHFFELGGNSLNIMTLITNIHKEFDVRISLVEIFNNLTIADQANIIIEAKKDLYFTIKSVEKKEYYILSSAQRGLYFLYTMQPEDLSYNNLILLEIKGNVDKEKMEEIFNQLIKRNESLRTSFIELEGKPFQKVNAKSKFQIVCYEKNNGDIDQIIDKFKKSFDLSQAPLMRVGLIKVDQEKSILMTDMHHIITDGTSLGVFQKEFMSLYNGKSLPELRIQYKDYCEWQNSKDIQQLMKSKEAYWLKEFEDGGTLLNLPMDFPRPEVKIAEGAIANFDIGEEQTEKLEALATEEDATMYMVMLAIANIMLSKLSGQEDIVVGTGVAGRVHSDLRNIIGLFVNILPLRNYPKRNKTFIGFLREVKERTLEAFENQEFQFEELVDMLVVKRDPSRTPLFDVGFQLQNIEIGNLDIPESNVRLYQDKNGRRYAKYYLSIIGRKIGRRIFFGVEYSPKLFKKETIETFIRYFKDVVSCVLENNHIQLNQIQISHGFIEQELVNPRANFNF